MNHLNNLNDLNDLDDLTKAYNYDIFVGAKIERWLNFEASPLIGVPAPDFPLTTLAGQTVNLSKIWRQAPYTIIEFGSLT